MSEPEDETRNGPIGADDSGVAAQEAATIAQEEKSRPASVEEETDEQITESLVRQGVRLGKGGVATAVFWPAFLIILAVAALAIAFPTTTSDVLLGIQGVIVADFGWYYMLVIAIFIAFAMFVGLSKYGSIKLGKPEDEPEFGLLSWFSMLFAAGMGIGLVFYGVGEPLTYATTMPKPGWEGSETDMAQLAMAQTFVHWGLHPWAIYAVIGLALSYAIHKRGRPISIRWSLEPIFGKHVKGWVGDVIDILAIFGTVFGVATSLGLGVQQIASGMQAIGILNTVDLTILIVLIVVITFLATLSVVSGLGKGIKWLSNINLSLAGLLLISVLLLGPTLFLFENFTESLGVYFANVFGMTFDVGAYTGEEGAAWMSSWTLFYWGWWISWAPFVGVFIARISRGRTIRTFVFGTLLVPTLVGFVWFSVMGGAGLFRQLFGAGDLVDPTDGVVAEKVLFTVLGDLPMGSILSIMAIILVAIFFITSSDSGSLVVDMLASGGHPNPPTWSRILWAALEGLLAAGLLAAGGLGALQAASLATALPFSIVLLLMCWSTFKALRVDYKNRERARVQDTVEQIADDLKDHFHDQFGEEFGEEIDDRIDYRIQRTTGALEQALKGKGGKPHRPDAPRTEPGSPPRH